MKPMGLNLVGLKRAGFSRGRHRGAQDRPTASCSVSGLKLEQALERIEAEIPTEHTGHLVSFVRRSERGICR